MIRVPSFPRGARPSRDRDNRSQNVLGRAPLVIVAVMVVPSGRPWASRRVIARNAVE